MKIAAAFITSLALACAAAGQHTNVLISSSGYPEEPSICINPRSPNQIVAGANINFYYLSDDSGKTWRSGTLKSSYGVAGDPTIITDTAGTFYFLHLSNTGGAGWLDRIVCQRLDDFQQARWSDGGYMGNTPPKDQDKQWAIVDPRTNTLYATWTQFDKYGSASGQDSSVILFSKSTDRGDTWTPAKRINKVAGDCIDSDNTVEGAVPAVGPNGEVYVAWAGPQGLAFNRSVNGGETWLAADIRISDFPGGWDYKIPGINRSNGLPVTVCDCSNSPWRGTIYVNWTDQRNGPDDTDVWLSKSTDGGNTWSTPRRVNNDGPGRQQFFTWMAVDQATGYLYFVFYDRRQYDDLRTDVYMAVSKDGGNTFTNFRISESPFVPDANVFFGDYTNVSAWNNVVRPIWTRLQNGQLSVWTALVDPTRVDTHETGADQLQTTDLYPTPAQRTIYFSFKLKKAARVNLKLVDSSGRELAQLLTDAWKQPDKYVIPVDVDQYHLAPGVYYFVFSDGEHTQSKKAVVTR